MLERERKEYLETAGGHRRKMAEAGRWFGFDSDESSGLSRRRREINVGPLMILDQFCDG